MKVNVGEVKPLSVQFSNSSVDPPDYTNQTLTLTAKDHEGVTMFTIVGEVSDSDTGTGDVVTFMTSAANTTTDLDAQLSPVRAAACDRTSLKYWVTHTDIGTDLVEGVIGIFEGPS